MEDRVWKDFIKKNEKGRRQSNLRYFDTSLQEHPDKHCTVDNERGDRRRINYLYGEKCLAILNVIENPDKYHTDNIS